MKLRSLFGIGCALAMAIASSAGCGDEGPKSEAKLLCTPGTNVFCRCADRTEGTKLCADDGMSYSTPCSTNEARTECTGGELPEEDSGVIEPPPDSGPPRDAIEACPGKSTAVSPGNDIVITGDTSGATDDAQGGGACATGAGGPDHVYRLIPTGSGVVRITVKGEGAFNPVAYIRSNCADVASQRSCANDTPAGGTETLNSTMVVGQEYFLFVDGASGTSGKYTVTIRLTTQPFCGDGKVTTGEACDDINKNDDDGCDPSCQKVNGDPTSSATCPGQPVHVWPGKLVTGTGSTTTGGTAWSKTGTSCGTGTNVSPEHIYEVTAHAAGTLTVVATPEATFNVQLIARKTCTDATTQVAGSGSGTPKGCSNDGSAGVAETLRVPVQNGEKVYVAADGILGGKGTYSITFSIK